MADPWVWFESFEEVPRIAPADLDVPVTGQDQAAGQDHVASQDQAFRDDQIGPHELTASEWIVQLSDETVDSIGHLAQLNGLFDSGSVDVTVVSGLGSPGTVLVRGIGVVDADVGAVLEASDHVRHHWRNGLIEAQASPNDSDFQAGLLSGLELVDATDAWDVSTGSLSTVVGVVDGGIDATHPDLFLNVWLNQGEIPPAIRTQVTDTDNDGLITFYDLNNLRVTPTGIVVASTSAVATVDQMTTATPFASGSNASVVRDLNGNGRIDAIDLLDDVNWADGRDGDGNRFFDDLFGVNFRDGADDPFPINKPLDELGHGTHVSGIVGAVGNNRFGVVGVNWQTSLMSLRILDNNNQADAAAAIRAVNYAKQMRADLRIDDSGRVESGAGVRVLNNSWGQPGGFDQALQQAIQESGDEGILFVAAAGNGNILGNGVDNDDTPFYPASYESENVVAVSALSADGSVLASFSNFGRESVDLAAPGVAIRSTVPGGFVFANGTSMATPHVAGTAALIWSAFPEATVAEVRAAILGSTEPITNGGDVLSTGGRLHSAAAINADVFAPAARLIAKQNVTVAGGASTEFVVEYSHRSGIDVSSIGNDDLTVVRQWGPADELAARVKPGSVASTGGVTTVTYVTDAPGGDWDPLDFGDYLISTVDGAVRAVGGNSTTEAREIGAFNVRIDDPTVLYVDVLDDSPGEGSLRDAIAVANAAGSPRTIILDRGQFTIDIPPVADPTSTFPDPNFDDSCGTGDHLTGWSNQSTGDFDVTGTIAIIGNQNDRTSIDANQLDRVFKVHPTGSLTLSRVTVSGGLSAPDQGGGGILSVGNLLIEDSIVRGNAALALQSDNPIRGGGVAVWSGNTDISRSWVDENESHFGGGVFYCGFASGVVLQSTISNNTGGGLHSHSDNGVFVNNSTFSANSGGNGAIFNGKRDGFDVANNVSSNARVSADASTVVFESGATNLLPGDTNGLQDIFAFDRQTGSLEKVSIASDGDEANLGGFSPSVSGDGNLVAFASISTNLIPGDNNNASDIFVFNRSTDVLERVSLTNSGGQANGSSFSPVISEDGRFVAFVSDATNLVANDQNSATDLFVHDRQTGSTERVSVGVGGVELNRPVFSFSLSANGRFLSYVTSASNIVPSDTNEVFDTYFFDRQTGLIQRVSVDNAGNGANGDSVFSAVSNDGRFIAFDSFASNLVAGDFNNVSDIYLFDRVTDSIRRISNGFIGDADGASTLPSFSADGSFLAFQSSASNLVLGDFNGVFDVFRYDLTLDQLTRISEGTFEGGNFDSRVPSLSRDGQVVAFETAADNLAPNDINRLTDVYIFDDQTGIFEVPTIIEPVVSNLIATQVTTAFTLDSEFAIGGRVSVDDLLLANNSSVNQLASSVSVTPFVLAPQFDAIGPLTQFGDAPPVHPLVENLVGNGAIDGGNPVSAGTVDQLGRIRDVPDVGAFEATSGRVAGRVFVDLNENQVFDEGEPGVAGVDVIADNQFGSRTDTSATDSADTIDQDETGQYEFADLQPGIVQFQLALPPSFSASTAKIATALPEAVVANGLATFSALSANGRFVAFESAANNLTSGDFNLSSDIFVYDRELDTIARVSVSDVPAEANGSSSQPTISATGRFVAYQSLANNIVPGDTNGVTDIFAIDRADNSITLVSQGLAGSPADGPSASASMSSDGMIVAFTSLASNLVANDTNNVSDIFVNDLNDGTIRRVSVGNGGVQANDQSVVPTVSPDGRYVAFQSLASNLVPNDNNGVGDIFVYDRVTDTVERVNLGVGGAEANGESANASISADGNFVSFHSIADNLVAGDTNGQIDVFVFNRADDSIEMISQGIGGVEANQDSFGTPRSISADGRFVAFASSATNLVEGDFNGEMDAFIFDRQTGTTSRVSVDADGVEADGATFNLSISADGRSITLASIATNLTNGDTNNFTDVFVTSNPLIEAGSSRDLRAGDSIGDFDLGLVPDPGVISGIVFEDLIQNESFDVGETPVPDVRVYLDANLNGLFDAGEVFTTSRPDGTYRFEDTPAFRDHSVAVQVPAGWEQVLPTSQQNRVWDIFLPAGGDVSGRDFGLRRVSGTGQSSLSSVSGRVYDDRNRNGVFDGADVALSNTVVFLDQQNFGVRDANEPAVETAADGSYTIGNLGSSVVAVSTVLDETLVHTSPLGSDFSLERFPLFDELRPFANPQAIAAGDFNGDSLPDVVVALGEANQVSIRLNDGSGGFLDQMIDVDLGADGGGPVALAVGQFNGQGTGLDVAVVNNFASSVSVLIDFNGTGFDSQTDIPVGEEPIDIVAAALRGDENNLDLVVLNRADSSVQVLTNNGSGIFSAQAATDSGGVSPVALVAGQFDDNGDLDIAIAHASSSSSDSPFGDVRLFVGNGSGSLTLAGPRFEVGATPTDIVSEDFDGDGFHDLAVSNFGSNSVSVLTGAANGVFTVQTQTLGTASGAFDLAVGDIDNDGDADILASNLLDRNISVFRNSTTTQGETFFEPLEAVGLGQFGLAQRMPLVVANFDGDQSAPGGLGTIDVIAVPSQTDTLHVLTNHLVNGAHRVELTGLNQVGGLDFVITPATLPPRIDAINDPQPILEDDDEQTVALTGIFKGRANGPALRIESTSSDPNLIPDPTVEHQDGQTVGSLRYTPVANANGVADITVTVTDAGADQTFDTVDDTVAFAQFSVTVMAVNDAPTFAFTEGVVTADPSDGAQTVAGFLTGISTGGGSDEATQTLSAFVVTSDRPELFAAAPTIDAQGNLDFTLNATSSGTTRIEVTLSDNGGTANQGKNSREAAFVITTPRSIVIDGNGNTILLSQLGSLDGVQLIDIRGSGDNQLALDADLMRQTFDDGNVQVLSDRGDTVQFDDGWTFQTATFVSGILNREFVNAGAVLNLAGPEDFTNPIDLFDVSGDGKVTSLDALQVINELSRRLFSVADGLGTLRSLASVSDFSRFRFFDVSRDERVTSLDALRVINELGRRSNSGSGEGEWLIGADDENDSQLSSDVVLSESNLWDELADDRSRWSGRWQDRPSSENLPKAGGQTDVAIEFVDDSAADSLKPGSVDAVLKLLA